MFAIQPIHARKPGTNCQPFGSGPYGQESRTREGAPEAENACSSELTDESAERFRFRVRRGSVNVVCGCGTVLCLVCLPFSVLPFVVGSFEILSMGTRCGGEYGRKVTDTEGKRLGCKRLDEINCSVRNERWLGNRFEIDLKYMSEQRPGELHSNDGGSALMNMMTVRWTIRVRKLFLSLISFIVPPFVTAQNEASADVLYNILVNLIEQLLFLMKVNLPCWIQ